MYLRNLAHHLFRTEESDRSNIIIRILVGGVFIWEGIIKFLYINQGIGRFTKLGFLHPDLTASFIGGLEILGGTMLMLGILTKPLSFIFIIQMLVAMYLTKLPLLFGNSPLAPPQAPPIFGIWAVLHEIRSEYSQALGCLFLYFSGPGRFSLDSFLKRRIFIGSNK
ncbi:DoxX family protein [Leptospira hartskeerlii]|uniref:DoxX family protein n=1 Tax=Leptospira hartskeerlii TaxID=2023177 RepID=A0A2M9XC25_9LEPT|nr:DoxX family protein [Leptospira hartskeerlii]PJZ25230.1 DoxX family protein [Leptospira hartskeerlii]PJZ33622.1 DoxX family protein [Leptospira hartskeerlii]